MLEDRSHIFLSLLQTVPEESRNIVADFVIELFKNLDLHMLTEEWQENFDAMQQLLVPNKNIPLNINICKNEYKDIIFSLVGSYEYKYISCSQTLEKFIRESATIRTDYQSERHDSFNIDLYKLMQFYRDNKDIIMEEQLSHMFTEIVHETIGKEFFAEHMKKKSTPKPRM
mgnify:CR=1 FL=1